MKTEAEALRQELARTAEEHISTFPSRPMVYPEELIERVIKYVREQARRGQSAVQSSQELGIPRTRLHYWLYGRTASYLPARSSVLRPPSAGLLPSQLVSMASPKSLPSMVTVGPPCIATVVPLPGA
jgi:hypothetical protein